MANVLLPFGTNPPQGPLIAGQQDLTERSIHSDPRELWYLCLPNKLTPQQVLQILRSALAGDVWQQWQLCSLMLDTWPTFRMAAHQLMESASYMRYAVHPFAEEGEKPTPQAIEKAGTVSRAMRAMSPNPFNDERGFSGMCYALCDAMLNGIALVELLWEYKTSANHGREFLPKSSAWVHPRHFTFTNEGTVAVYDENYNRLNFPLTAAPSISTPDPDKFLCSQFVSRAGSALGAGFMRPLAWAWAARQFNLEWMLNTAKRYGAPFLDITYAPGSVTTAGTDNDLDKLIEMAKTAGSSRVLVHPVGTTAAVTPAHSLGKENPQRVLEEKADDWCLFLLLGQKGTTVGTPGKLGNDDTQETVKEQRILGVANWLARNPLRQFARAVLRRNYGNDEECPELSPDTTKPLKPEQVGAMATSISGSRVPIRADEFYKKLGFTQPDPGETVFVGGKIMVMPEALTEDEQFKQDLGRQVKQAEVQMELYGEAQPSSNGGTTQAGERVPVKIVRAGAPRLRAMVARASNQELDELEALVVEAENARHLNGEHEAVKAKLKEIAER